MIKRSITPVREEGSVDEDKSQVDDSCAWQEISLSLEFFGTTQIEIFQQQ